MTVINMKIFIILLSFILGTIALPNPNFGRNALPCDPEECQLPDCRCSTVETPGGFDRDDTPQFVMLTFDDATTVNNVDYYREALYGRKNPNDCPISATFYVSHEYSDYSFTHELHANGHEIALHSISHNPDIDLWGKLTVEELEREFVDQKLIMEKFALIPPNEIKGIRMPFLQKAGNNQFEMLNDNEFLYDNSWPTGQFMNPALWPYSLKYRTSQDCPIGPCPTESFPNVWVMPMVQWNDDQDQFTCSMADACLNVGEPLDWMKREFHRHYDGNKAPFGFYLHAAWFQLNETRFDAYLEFLDYIGNLPDVFIASGTQIIEWVKNPKTVSEMMEPENAACPATYTPRCNKITCLHIDGNIERYFSNCASQCTTSYPWLGNPLGDAPIVTEAP